MPVVRRIDPLTGALTEFTRHASFSAAATREAKRSLIVLPKVLETRDEIFERIKKEVLGSSYPVLSRQLRPRTQAHELSLHHTFKSLIETRNRNKGPLYAGRDHRHLKHHAEAGAHEDTRERRTVLDLIADYVETVTELPGKMKEAQSKVDAVHKHVQEGKTFIVCSTKEIAGKVTGTSIKQADPGLNRMTETALGAGAGFAITGGVMVCLFTLAAIYDKVFKPGEQTPSDRPQIDPKKSAEQKSQKG